jgi:hypothetical protein
MINLYSLQHKLKNEKYATEYLNNISFHRMDSWYTIENINHGGKVKSTLKFGYYFNEPIFKQSLHCNEGSFKN